VAEILNIPADFVTYTSAFAVSFKQLSIPLIKPRVQSPPREH
jgi:hypothetical protein